MNLRYRRDCAPGLRLGGALARVAILATLVSGCFSDRPGSSSMARAVVGHSDADRVREAAVKVFSEEYYTLASETASEMIFEREGTQRDRLLYGRYERKLIMRVVVTLSPLPEGVLLLRADAFALDGGLGETPVRGLAGHPYRKLLDRVKEVAEATDKRAEK